MKFDRGAIIRKAQSVLCQKYTEVQRDFYNWNEVPYIGGLHHEAVLSPQFFRRENVTSLKWLIKKYDGKVRV